MLEWQIDRDDYFERLDTSVEEFVSRLHLPQLSRVGRIIPLRDIVKIESMIPIKQQLLLHLLRRVKTLDGRMPFVNIQLRLLKIDSRELLVGQRFVYAENYRQIIEKVPDLFSEFLISGNGLADLGANFIFGVDVEGRYSMSCYVPPLIEQHGPNRIIMDGVHRNYTTKQIGKTPNAILVTGTNLSFPCDARPWGEVEVISLADKPKELEDRFFELEKGLFRDLKHLGIDG